MIKKKKTVTKKVDKDVELKNIMRDINKQFGNNAIKFAVEEGEKVRLPFGVEKLDEFTGGGTVKGNFCIVYGANSCGKSSLAYTQIAECQRKGLVCAYFDLEHSYDPVWAEAFGVDLVKLVLVEGIKNAEEAMDILIILAKKKAIDYAVIDSIQAMSPKGEQETKKGKYKSVEDDTIALLARKMGQFLRSSKDYVYEAQIGVLLIGQIRTGGIGTFITRPTLTGGNALKHFSMLTLYMRRGQKADAPIRKYKHNFEDTEGKKHSITKEEIIGFDSVIKVEKHKLNGCSPELSDIHLPFYSSSGYNEPIKIEEGENDNESKDK